MLRPAFALSLALSLAFPTISHAQNEARGKGAKQQFNIGKIRVGDVLPDIVAFDPDGKEFKLSSLRGQHTVLVFGCLT